MMNQIKQNLLSPELIHQEPFVKAISFNKQDGDTLVRSFKHHRAYNRSDYIIHDVMLLKLQDTSGSVKVQTSIKDDIDCVGKQV